MLKVMFSFPFRQVKKRFALLTCCFVCILNFPVLAEDENLIYGYSNVNVFENNSFSYFENGIGSICGEECSLSGFDKGVTISNFSALSSNNTLNNNEIYIVGGSFNNAIIVVGGHLSTKNSGIEISNNKIVLKDGKFNSNLNLYGGANDGIFGNVDNISNLTAFSNLVDIEKTNILGEEINIYGAYITSEKSNVYKNKVSIISENSLVGGVGTGSITINGGLAFGSDSSSESNEISVLNGTFSAKSLSITGGTGYNNTDNNIVSVYKGNFLAEEDLGIYGGSSTDYSTGFIYSNKIFIFDGNFSGGSELFEIIGGADFSEKKEDVFNNEVYILGGNYENFSCIYAGFSGVGEAGEAGEVRNNKVYISNVVLDNDEIYGGYSLGGDVLNNKVILSKGSFENAKITGGLGEDSSLAKDNIVALMEGVDVTGSSISGGIADESLGNSLLVASNNLNAKSIDSFQNYYFIISEKNITLLSVKDGLNINLEDSKFDVVAKKGSVLSLGDTVTLLSKVELSNYSSNDDLKLSNDIQDILNQIKDEKENNLISVTDIYKFALEFDNNSLIARVIDVKEIPEKRLDLSNISSDNLEAAKTIDKANKEGAFSKEIYKKLVSSDSDAITDIKPENVQASIQNTVNISTMVNNAVNQRLFSRGSSGKNLKGKNGGDNGNNKVWGQLLYNHSKQSSSNDNPGFKSDTKGFAVGADTEITDNFVLGVGYAYDVTDIKSGNRDTDVDSHTFFAYANYDIDEHLFVKGNAGYSFAKYKEKVSYLGNKSKYDVNSILINSDVGYKFNNGLTPLFGLRYAFVDKKTYTDEANQKVKTKDTNVVRAVAGVDWSQKLKTNGFKWTPSAGVGVSYDINNIKSSAVVNVGSSSYSVEGKRLKRTSLEAHAGVSTSYKNWDFSVNYELNAREKFQSHTGMVKATYNF